MQVGCIDFSPEGRSRTCVVSSSFLPLGSGHHISSDGMQVDMCFADLSNVDRSLAELLLLISDPTSLEV